MSEACKEAIVGQGACVVIINLIKSGMNHACLGQGACVVIINLIKSGMNHACLYVSQQFYREWNHAMQRLLE